MEPMTDTRPGRLFWRVNDQLYHLVTLAARPTVAQPSVNILCPSRPSNFPRSKAFVGEDCSSKPDIDTTGARRTERVKLATFRLPKRICHNE
jgi:hypothetical protein